ncbi:MAG: ATP-binding cassette domain-containing protein [Clostridia bacterium]|nr:ATP-binding cassette domain-containing protein [Clostridia bacterium]
MENIIVTNNLCKKYGKFQALDNVSITIKKGGIYGLIGKNGAGKTTLLRVISGLQNPTSGKYSLFGVDYKDKNITKQRRKVGAIIEKPSIYLDMSATENLKQQCLILGIPNFDDILKILKLVGLDNAGKKPAKNFSLGMKQRLGIAIALVGNPDFIILDEPINGLDPQGIIEIRELILKLNKEFGITFLISSHILDELSKVATDFYFINNGKVIKEINSKELSTICKKITQIEVDDVKIVSSILTTENINFDVISNTQINIYSNIVLSELISKLSKENCTVISSTIKNESLESYFLNLIGGEDND